MQSLFEVPKRLETFFINTTNLNKNESTEFNIPIKSRIPDLISNFKIHHTWVQIHVIFPLILVNNQIADYSYLLVKSSKFPSLRNFILK